MSDGATVDPVFNMIIDMVEAIAALPAQPAVGNTAQRAGSEIQATRRIPEAVTKLRIRTPNV
jgi:hypothetical protein